MTEQQALNTLTWVEALLSGKYAHGRTYDYDPNTEQFSAIGVALDIFNLPIHPHEQVGNGWRHYAWYHETFGGNKSPYVISAVNDLSTNYLGVVALLLDTVPHCTVAIKRRSQAASFAMREAVRAFNSSSKR